MNSERFAYWLKGALELNPEMLEKGMTPEQVQTMKDHLDLVFNKITPDRFIDKAKIDTPDIPGVQLKDLEVNGSIEGVLYCAKDFGYSKDALICNKIDAVSTVSDSEEEKEVERPLSC